MSPGEQMLMRSRNLAVALELRRLRNFVNRMALAESGGRRAVLQIVD